MSKEQRTAVLFPGQGAYLPGSLLELHHGDQEAAAAIRAIDEAIVEFGGGLDDRPVLESGRTLDDLLAGATQSLQVSIFALSVAVFASLRRSLAPDAVLVGHSLGEISALTCAGAFSAAEGARIVRARTEAAQLTSAAAGGMLAVSANAEIADGLVRAAADPWVSVAAYNAPAQTVLSGPLPALDRLRAAAGALGISSVLLKSPFAFHNPMLAPAVEPFRTKIAEIRQRPLLRRVYSPILGRFYSDDDDLQELLVSHLQRPVRFLDAVRLLHSQSVSVFVECGARDALSALVRRTVPDVTTIASLAPGRAARETLDDAISRLTGTATGPVPAAVQTAPPTQLVQQSQPAHEPVPVPVAKPDVVLTVHWTPAAVPAVAPTVPGPRAGEAENSHDANFIEQPTVTRDTVLADLRASYATALDYPESLFTENADLEADLGVDSVKQTELLSRVTDRYDLSTLPADFRISELSTVGRIADFVLAATAAPAANLAAPPALPGQRVAEPSGFDRTRVLAELRATYAQALDYPESLLAENAHLEADLGVDSVKQTELLARITEQYALNTLPENFRLAELTTLGTIADLVMASPATAA